MGDPAVRVPAEMLERASALVEPVSGGTLHAARWNQTAVVRLALGWGLSWIEDSLAKGVPLAAPKVEAQWAGPAASAAGGVFTATKTPARLRKRPKKTAPAGEG
jgi:hypothetical protein